MTCPQDEPLDENSVVPVFIVGPVHTGDIGGPEVVELENETGAEATSDDFLNSNASSVDSLSDVSVYDPQEYSDFFTS